MNTSSTEIVCDPRKPAMALGRWCFGVMWLVFGIGKLGNVNGFAAMLVTQFEKTPLPSFLVNVFGHVLPFAEFAVGLLLLLGIYRNIALFGAGLLLILLTFGVALTKPEVVFNNTVYLFMNATLLFLGEHDTWVLYPRRKQEPENAEKVKRET